VSSIVKPVKMSKWQNGKMSKWPNYHDRRSKSVSK
jgi:hypothetical protein